MSTIYTANVTIKSGRDGSARSDDGRLDARLAFPVALGGDGQGTNPEQLFAAGYGACFAGTLTAIAKAEGKPVSDVEVGAEVDMMLRDGTYDLGVRLAVKAAGVDRATLDALVEKAKLACPYARATRNNVESRVRVEG